MAETPPDDDHPYGHGKAEPIAAASVSVMLLLAGGWIAFNALHVLNQPRVAPSATSPLLILIGVIAVKRIAVPICAARVRRPWPVPARWKATRGIGIAAMRSLRRRRSLGISISLIGGKGYEAADNWAAVAAAAVIAWNGWRLLLPAINELMDRSPDHRLVEEIRAVAGTIPGVDGVEKCFVRKMGYQFFVDMHVEVAPRMTVEHAHRISHEVKNKVRAEIPSVRDVLIHIEPSR